MPQSDQLGRERRLRNRKNPSSRFLAPDKDRDAQETAGVAGEVAVALFLGLPTDSIAASKRRKGYNLVSPIGETINVVTARKEPQYLPVEVGKVKADVYVLCWYHQDKERVSIMGWAPADSIRRQATGVLLKGGPTNHLHPAKHLRKMDDLKKRQEPQTLRMDLQ